ncbi:MAG: hypothetical protein OSJ60_17800 [Lachnospiraceae bacterium]|nr:hypothetical protein [Lachnospiraceae bacterium]
MTFAKDYEHQGQPIMLTEYGGIAFDCNNAENSFREIKSSFWNEIL